MTARVSSRNGSIELIVMPYEQETIVEHRGRIVREVVSRGAFDGIRTRPGRVQREPRPRPAAGRRARDQLPPLQRRKGSSPRFSDRRTRCSGRDARRSPNDGILDASAGFALMRRRPGAEEWPESRPPPAEQALPRPHRDDARPRLRGRAGTRRPVRTPRRGRDAHSGSRGHRGCDARTSNRSVRVRPAGHVLSAEPLNYLPGDRWSAGVAGDVADVAPGRNRQTFRNQEGPPQCAHQTRCSPARQPRSRSSRRSRTS